MSPITHPRVQEALQERNSLTRVPSLRRPLPQSFPELRQCLLELVLSEIPMRLLVSLTSFYQRALALGCTVTHLDKNRGSYSASLEENPYGAQSVVHRCAHILL